VSSYTQWIPFQLACRLHVLQQGALNVGNTQQNKLSLQALCVANANAGGLYARWSRGANAPTAGAQPITALQVYPALVPGYVKPVAS
jgi:hypothetical protein